MLDWSTLRAACEHEVAREIARPRVQKDGGWRAWPAETEKALPEAAEKINSMTNLELLDLIARVTGDA